tara:strand:- start:111 stop:653 length:543 start_codon:yes stop_codon:yes gene_type:complete
MLKCDCGKTYKYKASFNKHKASCKFVEIQNKTKINTVNNDKIDISLAILPEFNSPLLENISYSYDLDDPFIRDLYNKLLNRLKQVFTIVDNKIVVDSFETMTTTDIDNHNLCIVNELINIAQEQQKASHQCLIIENMNTIPSDIKYSYYKDVVKHIIFLYGEEVRMLSNMLISGLLLHKT